MALTQAAKKHDSANPLLATGASQHATQPASDALVGSVVHDKWEKRYRTPSNFNYFRSVIADTFAPFRQRGAEFQVLDAGCGSGVKSMLLAEMGFSVLAVDISTYALARARTRAANMASGGRVAFDTMDMCALDLEDEAMDAVVCWASLMHIPNVAGAVSEISRVLKPGGTALIVEGNCRSLQSRTMSLAHRLGLMSGRHGMGPLGVEIWKDTADGKVLIRHMDIPALAALAAKSGLALRRRGAGQFTEAYAWVSSGIASEAIQRLNRYWFERVRMAGPAYSNVLVFEKETAGRG